MHTFYVIPDIEHYTGKYVEYKREAYRQEWGIDKKQAYFTDRYIKAFAKVSTYPERITFKKSENPLQHISLKF